MHIKGGFSGMRVRSSELRKAASTKRASENQRRAGTAAANGGCYELGWFRSVGRNAMTTLSGISLLGLCLRLLFIGRKSFWDDEFQTMLVASRPFKEALTYTVQSDHTGFFYAIFSQLCSDPANSTEGICRLPYAIVGTLSIPLAFFLFRRFVSREIALLACVLMAVSPLYIQVSQDMRLYALLLFLFLWSTLAVVEMGRHAKVRVGLLGVYAIPTLLGLHTDCIPFLGFLVFHIVLLAMLKLSRRHVAFLLLAQCVALISLVPYVLVILSTRSHLVASDIAGGQVYRVFESPLAQLMMYLASYSRAVQSVTGPPWRYFKMLEFSLSAEKCLLGWFLFITGAVLLAYRVSIERASMEKRERRVVARAVVLVGLGSVFLSFLLLLRGMPNAAYLLFFFLLPVALSFVMMFVPLFAGSRLNARQTIFFLFVFPPILCGAKLLIPFDPRHFAVPLVFLLPAYAQGVLIACRRSRAVIIVMTIVFLGSLCEYYEKTTQIYKDMNYRALAFDISRSPENRSNVYASLGGLGNEILRYYMNRMRMEKGQNAVWIGDHAADKDIPFLKEMLSRQFERTGAEEGARRHCFILSLYRLEPSFLEFLRYLKSHYRVAERCYGDELFVLEISGTKG
jgi:hypothetical protein